ncbi:MAG TPA: hypothetical protein VMY42_01500 [Thermoguttaceae bacterium]|nr:hypothetical protein [Thermoguttaceae bacterium]
MTPHLTTEQREAIRANPHEPLRVEDAQTHKVYLLVAEEALPTLWDDYIRREVRKGLDAIDRGEFEDWEIESIKAEGRQILEQRGGESS